MAMDRPTLICPIRPKWVGLDIGGRSALEASLLAIRSAARATGSPTFIIGPATARLSVQQLFPDPEDFIAVETGVRSKDLATGMPASLFAPNGPIGPASLVVLVECRFPFLSANRITALIEKFEQGKGIWGFGRPAWGGLAPIPGAFAVDRTTISARPDAMAISVDARQLIQVSPVEVLDVEDPDGLRAIRALTALGA